MKKFYKTIRIIFACLFVLIGIIGLLIPVFPTVPFLILAAVIMGKKPSDVIRKFRWILKNIQIKYKRLVRRLRKNRSDKL